MPVRSRRGRRLPTAALPNLTASPIQAKASMSATLTNSGATIPHGPTAGNQAVRDAAGINSGPTVSVFSGTANTNFTQMVPGETTAQMQARIDNAVSLSTKKVWFPAGKYRVTTALQLKADTEYRLATGPLRTTADTAIVSGSEVVTGFTQDPLSSTRYLKAGQTQNFDSSDSSANNTDNPPAGTVYEAYFRDGIYLHPVAAKATVNNQTDVYFFDNTIDTVYIGKDPTVGGHTIERTRTQFFIFEIKNPNVTIRGGITEHAGSSNVRLSGTNTASPSTNPDDPSGFSLIDHESRYGRKQNFDGYGHAQGTGYPAFRIQDVSITRCYFHHGANYNFVMTWMNNVTMTQVESAYGNFLHYGARQVSPFGEGGDKTLFITNQTYTGMWSHDNDGAGTWQDTGVNTFILEESVMEDNYGSGIHYEQNSGGIIRFCYFGNNNRNETQPAPYNGSVSGVPTLTANAAAGFRDAAIFLSSSENTEIHNCEIDLDGRAALHMRHDDGRTYRLEGTWFHDNLVNHTQSASGTWDWMITYKDSDSFTYLATSNNRFNFNEYHVRTGGRSGGTGAGQALWFFAPSGTTRTFAQWQLGMVATGAGRSTPAQHDPNSTLTADQ